jgi:DNA primase catalytic core
MSPDPDFKRALEEIKARLTPEAMIREWGKEPVQRSNRLWATCPLHEEGTPSFAIGPDPGLWYCFGSCSKGGDLFDLICARLGISFIEAVEFAAQRTGVDLPKKRGPENKREEPGLKLLAHAERIYRDGLKGANGRAAREYLTSRGFEATTIEAFGIGYAPPSHGAGGNPISALTQGKGGAPVELAESVGLVRIGDRDGRPYDFFRHRLMIPIRDERGRTVGFGGRIMPGEEGPKYVNTPETPWFKKGRVIYGFDRALPHAQRNKQLILVEGYTDVMALHQGGILHGAAVLGTATTEAHARLVRRSGAQQVQLLFDGDDAGRKAAYKALKGLLSLDTEIFVVPLEDGQDPADILATEGAAGMTSRLEMGQPWIEFMIGGLKPLSGSDRVRGISEMFEMVAALSGGLLQDEALKGMAAGLDTPLDVLRTEYKGRKGASPRVSSTHKDVLIPAMESSQLNTHDSPSSGGELSPKEARSHEQMEKRCRYALAALFSTVLNEPGLFPRVRETLDGELSSEDSGRPLFDAMAKLWDNDEDPSLNLVLDELGDQPIRSRVAKLMQTLEGEEDLSQRTCEVLDEIKYCRNEQEILKVNGRIRVQQELCTETQPEDIRLQAEETLKSLRGNLMLLLSLRVPSGARLVDAP